MPFHPMLDQKWKWRRMEEDESVFVYKEGTLDQVTYNSYHFDKTSSNNGGNRCDSVVIRNKGNDPPVSCVVSLKDIVWLFSKGRKHTKKDTEFRFHKRPPSYPLGFFSTADWGSWTSCLGQQQERCNFFQ